MYTYAHVYVYDDVYASNYVYVSVCDHVQWYVYIQ